MKLEANVRTSRRFLTKLIALLMKESVSAATTLSARAAALASEVSTPADICASYEQKNEDERGDTG